MELKYSAVALALVGMVVIGAGVARTEAKAGAEAGPGMEVPEADEQAPAQYAVKLVTTEGDVVVDVTRDWAPRGADRFYTLVKHRYYTNVAFFRVIKGFMAQAGLSGVPELNTKWREKRIEDDPVVESNRRGMVTFAMAGKNSRTTQFFINFKDNLSLDGMRFAPFGKVREPGMDVVDRLYDGYGEGWPRGDGPDQGKIAEKGAKYLKAKFPKLDYIKSAAILP
ncbi:MAG: peptidylprolyl isomerase [Proteobacteria bacterium]|jgi:peptidyl-prolyl cis-trans isomerase A (cyclophilin A)|nr:peptidylprolyl isomerase [Pseudomonadota bacterium]